MLKQSAGRRRSFRPQLEQLEDRMAPAVLVEAYPGAPYMNPYGTSMAGEHNLMAPYITPPPASLPREVVLDPVSPTATSGPSANWKAEVEGRYGNPWNFTYAASSPPGLTLTVKTYYAVASSTISVFATYGGTVGGVIDVASNLEPAPGQTAHWIQVITTNVPPPGTSVGQTVSYVDAGQTSPYYGDYDQRGFTDVSYRNTFANNIVWQGEVYLVVETAANQVTVYPDGFIWGWRTQERGALETPSLSVAADPNPTIPFQNTTITATFTLPATTAPDPTGIVEFVVDATATTPGVFLGMANIEKVNGVVQASWTTFFGPNQVGNHTVRATYSGDTWWYGATATYTHTVNKVAAQLNVNPSINPAVVGQAVTLTSLVTGVAGLPSPTGTVIFYDGEVLLGSGTIVDGQASLVTTFTSVGTHALTAVYQGDDNYLVNTSPVYNESVAKDSTTTMLASSNPMAQVGQPITFTATVDAAISSFTPTGTVQFWDMSAPGGPVLLGTGTLDANGQATFTTSSLSQGMHEIKAIYLGDDNFFSSFASIWQSIMPPMP